MKGFRTFLSYYSIIVVTFLSVGTLFFYRNPQGIATIILLIPVTVYFWVKLSDPSHVNSPQWSARTVVIIFVFALLGIYSLTLFRVLPEPKPANKSAPEIGFKPNQKDDEAQKAINESIESLTLEIAELRTQLALGEGLSLGAETEKAPEVDSTVGFITVKNNNLKGLDVYNDVKPSAPVIGTLSYGNDYPFYENVDGWYQVRLPNKNIGWVQAEFVEQVE